MTVQEAKDFLVEQATQQASLDGVSISDLEKRMMYFTESDEAVENPITLNEEFEAKYDMAEYEAKVGGLLRRAYARLRKENTLNAQKWKESVRFLQKGDHYILVLCGTLMPVGGSPVVSFGGSRTTLLISATALAALASPYSPLSQQRNALDRAIITHNLRSQLRLFRNSAHVLQKATNAMV